MYRIESGALPMLILPGALAGLLFCCNSCQENPSRSDSRAGEAFLIPVVPATASASPSSSTSVQVYIELVIEKKYGMLAHAFGHHDATESRVAYDAKNEWWMNPLLVFADPSIVQPDVTAHSDAAPLIGKGESSNVAVALTLIPHADVAFKGLAKCDGVKGTITISVSTINDYFDDAWTQMLLSKDRKISFAFDTCEPGVPVDAVTHETRSLPLFVFQRYTREHQRWDARKEWPSEPEAGDFRTTIVGKDAALEITGYQYKRVASAGRTP